MNLLGIQILQTCRHLVPLIQWGLFFRCILSQTIRALLIKYRLCLIELDRRNRFWLFGLADDLVFEFLRPKPLIIASKPGAIFRTDFLRVFAEVVLQFFLECPLTERICHFCFFVIGLVHFPSRFHRGRIIAFENIKGVHHEVVEVIGCTQHRDRNIPVIIAGIFQIYISAMASDGAKFETDLFGCRAILF